MKNVMTEDGQVSGLIELENAYYVVQMDAVVDAEATEANRETIIAGRESALYTEVIDGYLKEMTWELDQREWAKISFDNLFTVYEIEAETEEVETTEK